MLASVAGEMAVVAVDHRDARAHEAGEVEDGDARPEREGGVGVAQVVETPQRLDAGGRLCGPPFAGAEVVEVEVAAPRRREQQGLSMRGSRSSASSAIACSGTARVLRRVFVCLSCPCAYGRRT